MGEENILEFVNVFVFDIDTGMGDNWSDISVNRDEMIMGLYVIFIEFS